MLVEQVAEVGRDPIFAAIQRLHGTRAEALAQAIADEGEERLGSAYLLYIAYLVAGSGAAKRASVGRPLGLWQAIVFQWVNPKAWVFAVAAVRTFLPPDVHRVVATALLTGTLKGVVIVSASTWAAGGAALCRVVEDGRRRRAVSLALAVLLVASVVLIWV